MGRWTCAGQAAGAGADGVALRKGVEAILTVDVCACGSVVLVLKNAARVVALWSSMVVLPILIYHRVLSKEDWLVVGELRSEVAWHLAHVVEHVIAIEIIYVGRNVREHAEFQGGILVVEIEAGNVEIEKGWIARVKRYLAVLHRLRRLIQRLHWRSILTAGGVEWRRNWRLRTSKGRVM